MSECQIPTTPLIDDEDFPTIKVNHPIGSSNYTKLDNSLTPQEEGVPPSFYGQSRSLARYYILFLSVIGIACVSLSVYVLHRIIPNTPSINQLQLIPSLYSPLQRASPSLDSLIHSPKIHSGRQNARQHILFSFLARAKPTPRKWTSPQWNSTFKAYLRYFNISPQTNGHPRIMDRLMATFKSNVLRIEHHNELAALTRAPQFLRINQFTHLTFEEFQQIYLRTSTMELATIESHNSDTRVFSGELLNDVNNISLPKSMDWFERGCVTPVKDQAKCGSCWAFSSTGAIEGAVCAQGGPLVSLSEQELVDCAQEEGAQGCDGGYMDNAFKYVMDHQGLCSEEDYPYLGKVDRCRHKCQKVANIKGILSIPKDNEKAVRAALVSFGPVAAGVEADRQEFQFYHSGVFSLPCGKKLNHAILIVGYGIEETTGIPFWLVKNSWGPQWGDHGYIKLARKGHGRAGECGILLSPTAPLIA